MKTLARRYLFTQIRRRREVAPKHPGSSSLIRWLYRDELTHIYSKAHYCNVTEVTWNAVLDGDQRAHVSSSSKVPIDTGCISMQEQTYIGIYKSSEWAFASIMDTYSKSTISRRRDC